MDASTLTGPGKNFLRFARLARVRSEGRAKISLVTIVRSRGTEAVLENDFIAAARAVPVDVDVIRERYRFDRKVLEQLRRVLRERSPDLIQSHGVKVHVLTRLAKSKRERWLAYHHGYTAEDWKMRAYNQLDRWSLPGADRVVTVCQPFAEMLVRRGVRRERIRVLPNSIEPEFGGGGGGREIRRQWGLAENEAVVLAVGRLSAEKGHRDLIEAVRILQRAGKAPAVHLVLVGDGPERERLAHHAEAAGLSDRVHFAGHQKKPGPYYDAANVFVLPSHTEGSPNVLLEAMVAGVPAVACAVGGVPECVENERSALLVGPRDPDALARAIARVLTETPLAEQLRRGAAATVRERHAPEAYCDALLQIYRELLPGRMA